jgi:hypothetical protein
MKQVRSLSIFCSWSEKKMKIVMPTKKFVKVRTSEKRSQRAKNDFALRMTMAFQNDKKTTYTYLPIKEEDSLSQRNKRHTQNAIISNVVS